MPHTVFVPSSPRRSYVAAGFALAVISLAASLPAATAQQSLLAAATRAPVLPAASQGQPEPAAPQAAGEASTSFKDDLFAGTEKFAKGATDATEVNMDPDSLGMVGGPDAARAHRTLLNVVHSYTYEKPGMYNPADVEEFRRKLEGGDWHCSVHTRDLKSGESTDVCNRRRAPDLLETAIITMAPKELTFIHTIRKSDGRGGKLEGSGLDSLSGDLSLALFGALGPQMQAQMQAQMLASQATLQASMAELQVEMPSLDHLQEDLAALPQKDPLIRSKDFKALQRQLKDMEKHQPRPR